LGGDIPTRGQYDQTLRRPSSNYERKEKEEPPQIAVHETKRTGKTKNHPGQKDGGELFVL